MILNANRVDTKEFSAERLGVNFTTERPISAEDLADAFKGLSSMYRREMSRVANTDGLEGAEFLLYITEIKTKCIDAELAAYTGSALQVIQIMDYTLIIDQFRSRFRELIERFALRGRQSEKGAPAEVEATLTEAKDLVKIIKAAGNGGIKIEKRRCTEGNNCIVEERIEFLLPTVRQAYDGATDYINENTSSEEADYKKVALQLTRLDKDHHGMSARSPERGIIETISKKPLPVHWVSEMDSMAAKSIKESNLFDLVFTVDVKVDTVRSKPVSYRILKLHHWEDLEGNSEMPE